MSWRVTRWSAGHAKEGGDQPASGRSRIVWETNNSPLPPFSHNPSFLLSTLSVNFLSMTLAFVWHEGASFSKQNKRWICQNSEAFQRGKRGGGISYIMGLFQWMQSYGSHYAVQHLRWKHLGSCIHHMQIKKGRGFKSYSGFSMSHFCCMRPCWETMYKTYILFSFLERKLLVYSCCSHHSSLGLH